MAKVTSLFKISGTIGDLTFRQTQDGMIAQMKPGPTREQVLTHKRFECTRRNAGEFKMAIKDATLLRRGFGSALDGVHHAKLNGMMNKLLHAAGKQDTRNRMGYRHALAGNISLLAGFDFNPNLLLDKVFRVPYEHSTDITTGALHIVVPCFIARKKKTFPAGATHFRIVSCGVAVNFIDTRHVNAIETSELLPLGKKTPEAILLEHAVKASPGDVVVHAIGIEFYKIVHGEMELLKYGALQILSAAEIKDGSNELPVEGVEEKKPYKARDLRAYGDYRLMLKSLMKKGKEALREGNKALRQEGNEEEERQEGNET